MFSYLLKKVYNSDIISVMIKKCLLLILLLFLGLPSFAGEVENAINKGHNIFLYLYTPDCKYCQMYSPMYNKLSKAHNGEFVFIKEDASTKYGRKLMYEFRGSYVPYVVMINGAKKKAMQILPDCMMDTVCTEVEMKKFRG